jgi:putative flippase GtrA
LGVTLDGIRLTLAVVSYILANLIGSIIIQLANFLGLQGWQKRKKEKNFLHYFLLVENEI